MVTLYRSFKEKAGYEFETAIAIINHRSCAFQEKTKGTSHRLYAEQLGVAEIASGTVVLVPKAAVSANVEWYGEGFAVSINGKLGAILFLPLVTHISELLIEQILSSWLAGF
jgi:hypothetical protein